MPCDKMCLIKAFIYQTIYIKDEKKSRQALEFFFSAEKKVQFLGCPYLSSWLPHPLPPAWLRERGWVYLGTVITCYILNNQVGVT